MKQTKWLLAAALGSMLVLQGLAFADEAQKTAKADTKDAFDAVAAAVKQEMQPGGRYEFVDGQNRVTVNQKLDEMSSLFNQFGSVDKMDQPSKVRLYNDQELVDGILTKDDSNREVCTREASLGSNIPHVTCRTYGQIRREQNGTQDALRQMNRQMTQERGREGIPNGAGNIGGPVSH